MLKIAEDFPANIFNAVCLMYEFHKNKSVAKQIFATFMVIN
jgi:hypothetical protein